MEKEYRIPTHFSDDRVTEALDMVPSQFWMMSDETKKWVVCGHTPGTKPCCSRKSPRQKNSGR